MAYVPPKYPSEIPTIEDLPNRQDDVHWIKAARYNELKKELRAALIELGALPKGAYADVKTRLNVQQKKLSDADGDTKVDVEESTDEDIVRMDVAGVEAFKLNTDGILDLAKQSRCRVYRSTSTQPIPSGADDKLEFNGESYDNQNEFDPTVNYRFTAKKAGYYLVSSAVFWLTVTADSLYALGFKKNGAWVSYNSFYARHTGNESAVLGDVQYLNANDYIESWVYQNSGAEETINNGTLKTFMSIHKLS